jgi:hypothetical protein
MSDNWKGEPEIKDTPLPDAATVFARGRAAAEDGMPIFLNPYRKTDREQDWRKGWNDGMRWK